MDFDAALLIFLFLFFVLPLIQRVLGGTKQAPPQGGTPDPRGPDVPPQRAEGRARLPGDAHTGTSNRTDTGEPVRAEPERAADLIPDDIWEILTGERRSRTPSQRRHAPVAEPVHETETEWGRDTPAAWQQQETVAQVPEPDEQEPLQWSDRLELPRRREREGTAGTTITTPPTPAPISASGSASPHAVRGASPYAAADATVLPPSRARSHNPHTRRRNMAQLLSNRSDLKRAFVLREVLGPPKALE